MASITVVDLPKSQTLAHPQMASLRGGQGPGLPGLSVVNVAIDIDLNLLLEINLYTCLT